MRIPRPSTLWRALNLELWRLLLLTAAVVVVITAFALTVQPLASGRLGPVDALRFMGYASLPMLQYALPFAAGFAATLVYHRLGADNELTACFAGGISHRKLLFPALATGAILSAVLMLVADQAMPRFLRSMQELITRDVTQIIVASIKRGESIQFDRQRAIYADDVTTLGPDAESGAFERLVLTGVLAVKLDHQGRVIQEAASSVAYVWLFRGPRAPLAVAAPIHPATEPSARAGSVTTIVLRLRDSIGRQDRTGMAEWDDTTLVEAVPDAFEDDPKYWSWLALNQLAREPERMEWIDRRRRTLAGLLAESSAVEAIGRQLTKSGRADLADPADRPVTLAARGLGAPGTGANEGWWSLEPTDGFVEVRTRGAGASSPSGRVQRARRGWISAPPTPERQTTAISIRLEDVAVAAADPLAFGTGEAPAEGEPIGGLSAWVTEGLSFSTDPLPGLLRQPSAQLIEQSRAIKDDARLSAAANELDAQVASLRREILSKQQERLASSAACLVMVLCGAVLAMRLRERLPLTVYLWSFLPALLTILSISGGQRLTHQHGPIGLLLLWGGVAGLALFTLVEFARLARR